MWRGANDTRDARWVPRFYLESKIGVLLPGGNHKEGLRNLAVLRAVGSSVCRAVTAVQNTSATSNPASSLFALV